MLFDSEFLKKLEYLSLVSKRVFRGSLLAQRRTMQLGTGVEFADHREYHPGDDYRHLDWNLFARHDQLMVESELLQGELRQHDVDAQIVDQENIFHPAC